MPAHHIAHDRALHRTTSSGPEGNTERSAMSDQATGLGDTGGYEIRTRGRVTERWSDWFEGMDLVHDPDGTTLIRCSALDQAALHGVIAKVRDLGLSLISVTPIARSPER
jgi:hypothetical protein